LILVDNDRDDDQDNDGLPNQQVHVIAAGAAKRDLRRSAQNASD
jgi:hypothetical protein